MQLPNNPASFLPGSTIVKLEGKLATFPLRELIDMIVYSSVTGVLNVYAPGANGHLYFRDGHLYHIDRSDQQGVEALADLFELEDSGFAFVSDLTSPEETLWGDLDYHVQSAERLAQRWRQVRAYIPTMSLIPVLTLAPEAAQRRIGPAHYPVLDVIDGTLSLSTLATILGWAPIDVAEAAVEMSLDGVIDLRRSPAQPTLQAGDSGQQGDRGLFDRILAVATAARPLAAAVPVPAESGARGSADESILRLLRG
jgi:Domain of unknown function (DUF4388)